MTLADAQLLANRRGAWREQRAPVARIVLHDGSTNIASAYDAERNHLFDFGWRPFEREHDDVGGLILC